MNRINNPTEPLSLAAKLFCGARDALLTARGLLSGNMIVQAKTHLASADTQLQQAIGVMKAAGVEMPEGETLRPDVPLALLDTPATRNLLAKLRAAQEAAEMVDEERGWVHTDGSFCGWSEKLEGDVIRLSIEVEGPKGKD